MGERPGARTWPTRGEAAHSVLQNRPPRPPLRPALDRVRDAPSISSMNSNQHTTPPPATPLTWWPCSSLRRAAFYLLTISLPDHFQAINRLPKHKILFFLPSQLLPSAPRFRGNTPSLQAITPPPPAPSQHHPSTIPAPPPAEIAKRSAPASVKLRSGSRVARQGTFR